MYRVRYYGEQIHPDNFTQGMLGKAIRGVNWVRWKLETFNQRLVLKYMLKEQPFDKEKKDSLIAKFFIDVEAEKVEAKLTSPKVQQATVAPQDVYLRAERYTKRGHGKALDEAVAEEQSGGQRVLPMRPVSIEGLASRMTAQGRARRYTRERTNPLSMEAQFEPVPPEHFGGEEYGRPDRGGSAPNIEEAHSSSARFTPYQGWRPPT